jgi:hypothetical protein
MNNLSATDNELLIYSIYLQTNVTHAFMKWTLFSILLLAINTSVSAAAYKGTVKNQDGEILPYASIFVKNTNLGTNSNANGEFSISLEPGTYEIIFRYLGYETISKSITIGQTNVTENITMKPTVILLKEAVIGNSKEDPAMTIMRKTVAMSEIHDKELAAYTYRAYLKGNMKVTDAPMFMEKVLEKQYIKLNQLYVFEFVSEVAFKQPNTVTQRITGKKDNLPPTLRDNIDVQAGIGRFGLYNPADIYSPVTVKGVRNYNFEYLGYFEEAGRIINKIKVIPKRNIENVESGVLNIVDGSWYIHSYDFKSKVSNGTVRTEVINELIDDVWVPNNFKSSADVEALGFTIKTNAVISFKDMKLTKNPKYARLKPTIIDEKLFVNERISKTEIKSSDKKKSELTIQDLMTLKKEFAKEDKAELRSKKEADVLSVRNYVIDSSARERDSTFWNIERQVPLTVNEIKGFEQADSIVIANFDEISKKLKKDSVKKAEPNKFKITHMLGENTYKYGKVTDSLSTYYRDNFILGSIFDDSRFNAVEGYATGIPGFKYQRNYSKNDYFNIGVNTYYSFQRKRLNGDIRTEYKTERISLKAEAGRRVFQFNENEPITPILNAANALLNGVHYAKFYENTYAKVDATYKPSAKWKVGSGVRISNRSFLENVVNNGWRNKETLFESNTFRHENGTSSAFENNRLTEWNVSLSFAPRGTISYYNSKKQLNFQNSPRFTISNTSAFGNGAYNLLDFTAVHTQRLGKSSFETRLSVGTFYGQKPIYLLDYKYFNGNLLFTMEGSDFRNLDYYRYSSDENYLTWFNEFRPNKFILSSLPFVAKRGIKEYIFHNLLVNPYITHQEVGYGISLLNLLKFEVIGDFNNGIFNQFSFRLRGDLPN